MSRHASGPRSGSSNRSTRMTRSAGGRRRASKPSVWSKLLPSRTPKATGITIPPSAYHDRAHDQAGYDTYQAHAQDQPEPAERWADPARYGTGSHSVPGLAASSYHPQWSHETTTTLLPTTHPSGATPTASPHEGVGSWNATVLGGAPSRGRSRRQPRFTDSLPCLSPMTLAIVGLVVAALVLGVVLMIHSSQTGTTEAASQSSTITGEPNGAQDLSADQIAAKALEASKKAGTVRMRFERTSTDANASVDVRMVGTQGQGTLVNNGLSLEFICLDQRVFVKGSEAYNQAWSPNGEWAKIFADRWLTSNEQTKGYDMLAGFCDFPFLISDTLAMSKPITKQEPTTIDGQPAIEIRSADKVMYVATRGDPYVLGVDKLSGNKDKYRFSEWGKTLEINEPAADKQFDITKAKQSGAAQPAPPSVPAQN